MEECYIMSTYIFERAPNYFDGKQQVFVDASNAIVKNATDLFRSVKGSNQDLTQLFFSTLASFGAARHSVAVSQGTSYAEDFGVRRDRQKGIATLFPLTPLVHPYNEYNKRLLPVIQKQLKSMEYDKVAFKQTKSQVSFDPCLGREAMMEYSILTEEIKNWQKIRFSEEDHQRIYELCEVRPYYHFSDLIRNKEAMQKLREKSPNDYRRLKLLTFYDFLKYTVSPEEKKIGLDPRYGPLSSQWQNAGPFRIFNMGRP